MKYHKLNVEDFIISYPVDLQDYINDSIKIFLKQKEYLKELFNADKKEHIQLKATYFSSHKDFKNYIKKLSGETIEDWVTGCFYNGEVQAYINLDNIKSLEFNKGTLLHETIHLYFNNYVYKKYKLKRICWFDEAFATYLGSKHTNQYIEQRTIDLLNAPKNFDVNDLNKRYISTEQYDAYDMFMVIGAYIFENRLEKEYLNTLKNDYEEMRKIGRTILSKAIDYYVKKFNIEVTNTNART